MGAAGCSSADGTAPVAPVVGSIVIDGGSFALERGFHKTLTATMKNKAGELLTIPVVWRSSNETVATIDAAGRVTAVDTGATLVVATTIGIVSEPIALLVVWQGAAKVATYQFVPPNAATPGATVADSIRVQITDRAGGPVPGAKVAFAVTAGGGSLSSATGTTNQNGVAAVRWTLGGALGWNTLSATVLGDDDKPLAFVAANPVSVSIKTFAALVAVAGDGQQGQILSALRVAPSIRVVDSAGKPRAGVPVTFSVTGGGRVATPTVSTGADGTASSGTWTLGDVPGKQSLVVKVESAMLTLNATATGSPLYYIPAQLAGGGAATCAILTAGTVECWGEQPKVGDGTSTNRSVPTATYGGIRLASLAGGETHFCGIGATDQAAYCWGVNALTDTTGRFPRADVPTRLPSTITWRTVAPGFVHNCALAVNQSVYCWGLNGYGQLGDGTSATHFAPAKVYGGFTFTSVVSGGYHSCGLTPSRAAFCWGLNRLGQLGDSSTTNRLTPTAVKGAIAFESLSAGENSTCGLATTGRVYCWGDVSGSGVAQTTPQGYTTAPTFTSLSVGGNHACALTADGTGHCWGSNVVGQLGDSTTTNRPDPTPVARGLKFKSISAGMHHTCAQTRDGPVACWGMNRFGELGDTTVGPRPAPRYIILGVNP
jgi:alpha-tubulin suppressor-like RCC1 family protein